MRYHFLLAALLLAGCRPSIDDPRYFYEVKPFASVRSEFAIPRDHIQANVDLALSMLAPLGIEPALYADVDVAIMASYSVQGQAGGGYLDGTIYLNRQGGSLLHEMLHHYEREVLGRTTSNFNHEGWKERGWQDLSVAYWKACKQYRPAVESP